MMDKDSGKVRNQSWCKDCRGKATIESRKAHKDKFIKEVEQGESSEKAQKRLCSRENLNRTGPSCMVKGRPHKSGNKKQFGPEPKEQNGKKPQTTKDRKTPEESGVADQSNAQS